MPNGEDKLKILYDAVSKDYDIGTEQEFRTKLADPNKRRAFYDGVGAEYQLGTFEEFEYKVAPELKKKEPTQPTSKTFFEQVGYTPAGTPSKTTYPTTSTVISGRELGATIEQPEPPAKFKPNVAKLQLDEMLKKGYEKNYEALDADPLVKEQNFREFLKKGKEKAAKKRPYISEEEVKAYAKEYPILDYFEEQTLTPELARGILQYAKENPVELTDIRNKYKPNEKLDADDQERIFRLVNQAPQSAQQTIEELNQSSIAPIAQNVLKRLNDLEGKTKAFNIKYPRWQQRQTELAERLQQNTNDQEAFTELEQMQNNPEYLAIMQESEGIQKSLNPFGDGQPNVVGEQVQRYFDALQSIAIPEQQYNEAVSSSRAIKTKKAQELQQEQSFEAAMKAIGASNMLGTGGNAEKGARAAVEFYRGTINVLEGVDRFLLEAYKSGSETILGAEGSREDPIYMFTDKVSDAISNGADKITPYAPDYKVVDEKGNFSLDNLMYSITGNAPQFLALALGNAAAAPRLTAILGSEKAANALATLGGVYATSYASYNDLAEQYGLSGADKALFANKMAFNEAMWESLLPNQKVFTRSIKDNITKQFLTDLATKGQASALKTAFKSSGQYAAQFLKDGVFAGVEEMGAGYTDAVFNELINRTKSTGQLLPTALPTFTENVNAFLPAFALGAIPSAVSSARELNLQQSAIMSQAAKDINATMDLLEQTQLADEQKAKIAEILINYKQTQEEFGNISDAKTAYVTPRVSEVEFLNEQAAKATNPVVKTALEKKAQDIQKEINEAVALSDKDFAKVFEKEYKPIAQENELQEPETVQEPVQTEKVSEQQPQPVVETVGEVVSEQPVEPQVGAEQIKQFGDRIIAGETLTTPEDLQFYENYKDSIESYLQKQPEVKYKKGQQFDIKSVKKEYPDFESISEKNEKPFNNQDVLKEAIVEGLSKTLKTKFEGATTSQYGKIETPFGTVKIRVSDHVGYNPEVQKKIKGGVDFVISLVINDKEQSREINQERDDLVSIVYNPKDYSINNEEDAVSFYDSIYSDVIGSLKQFQKSAEQKTTPAKTEEAVEAVEEPVKVEEKKYLKTKYTSYPEFGSAFSDKNAKEKPERDDVYEIKQISDTEAELHITDDTKRQQLALTSPEFFFTGISKGIDIVDYKPEKVYMIQPGKLKKTGDRWDVVSPIQLSYDKPVKKPVKKLNPEEVDQKSGQIVPRVELAKEEGTVSPKNKNTFDALVKGNKIILDEKGKIKEVKQNSGYPSQLYQDLSSIIGDKGDALNKYLEIKDDKGEFKKQFGDWENSIMKDFGRAGREYKIIKSPVDENSFISVKEDGNNLTLSFNEKKLGRDRDFNKTKKEFADTISDPKTKSLYNTTVNKLRDLKLHLIHKALGASDVESLNEVERINNISLAKDYYGEPMIIMHSGGEGITKFRKPGGEGYVKNDPLTQRGIYFMRDVDQARKYARMQNKEVGKGKDIYYAFLKTANPYYITDPFAQAKYPMPNSIGITEKDEKALRELGYDSVIWDGENAPKFEVVVFDPEQIEIVATYRKGLVQPETKEEKPIVKKNNDIDKYDKGLSKVISSGDRSVIEKTFIDAVGGGDLHGAGIVASKIYGIDRTLNVKHIYQDIEFLSKVSKALIKEGEKIEKENEIKKDLEKPPKTEEITKVVEEPVKAEEKPAIPEKELTKLNTEAQKLGYENIYQATASFNKREGTNYTDYRKIPKSQLKSVAQARKIEKIQERIDKYNEVPEFTRPYEEFTKNFRLKGEPVKLSVEGDFEVDSMGKEYVVYETSRGYEVGRGKTKSKAIEDAETNLKNRLPKGVTVAEQSEKTNKQGYRQIIRQSLSNQLGLKPRMIEAIEEGVITVEQAIKNIEQAGLEVPQEILDLKKAPQKPISEGTEEPIVEGKAEKPKPAEEPKPEKQIEESAKRIAEAVRKGKITRPDAFSVSVGAKVWDSALEIVATTIETGGTVAQAISDGIKYIKSTDWYKGLDEERKKSAISSFEKSFEEPTEQPEPKKEEQLSGIKKALVPEEVIEDTDIEKRSASQMLETGRVLVDSGEIVPETIVAEINKKARALQPEEVAALVYYKARLDNQYNSTLDKIESARESGDYETEISERDRLVAIQETIEAYHEMAVKTAYEQSLAFRLRQMLLDNEYSLQSQIARYKSINDGYIPSEVLAKFQKLDEELKAVNKELAALKEKIDKQEADSQVENIVEAVDREYKKKGQKKPSLTKEKRELKKSLEQELRKEYFGRFNDITGVAQILADKRLYKYAALVIEETAGDFNNFAKEMINTVGKGVRPYLPEIYKKAGGKEEPIFADETPRLEDGKLVIPEKLIRNLVASGFDTIDTLVDEIYNMIKVDIPDVTKRQIRDTVTKYGRTANLSKDELDVKIREVKRTGRFISAYEDVLAKKRPLRSGLQRDKLNAEERRLQKAIKEGLKDIPLEQGDIEKAWATALDAVKSRLRNQIEDLQKQIETGEKTPKREGIKYDQEAQALVEQRDALKAIIESVEGKQKMSDEQRMKMAVRAVEKGILDLQKRIDNKDFSTKEKPNPLSSETLDELKAKREFLKEQYAELEKEYGIAEKKQLERYKKSLDASVKRYEKRIKEGDFVPKAKKPKPVLDEEAKELMKKKLAIQDEFNTEQEKNRLNNRSLLQKVGDTMADILNLPKSAISTLDLSAPFRQGAILGISNPSLAYKAGGEMFKQMASQKAADKFLNEIRTSDDYILMRDSGLYLAEPSARLSAKEEAFMSNIINKIPIYGKLTKGSERGYNAYLNKLRADLFASQAQFLKDEGYDPRLDEKVYKDLASFINNATGRGTMSKALESSVPLLNAALFSPRYIASRLNLLNPVYYAKLSPPVRRIALVSMGKYIGFNLVILGLIAFAFQDDEDVKVGYDPRSADFGKIIVNGKIRYDIWAGFSQPIVLIMRILLGQTKSTTSGKIYDLNPENKTPYSKTYADILLNFTRSKVSPAVGTAWNFAEGENMVGEKVTIWNQAMNLLIPIYVNDVIKMAYEGESGKDIARVVIPSFFGVGSQFYEEKEKKPENNSKKEYKAP